MSNFKEILERINSVSLIAQMAKTMKLISIKIQNYLCRITTYFLQKKLAKKTSKK